MRPKMMDLSKALVEGVVEKIKVASAGTIAGEVASAVADAGTVAVIRM